MPVKRYKVLHGGSNNVASHYATSSAVAQRGLAISPRLPATPWMGEGQSRIGYVDSGFSTQYTRDKPPGDGKIGHETAYRDTFSRPETAPAPYPWPGMKNRQPLKACFHRGADKEPRFYPLAMGAKDSSETLIAPPEGHGISADPKARFEGGYANKAAHHARVSSRCSPRLLFIYLCVRDSQGDEHLCQPGRHPAKAGQAHRRQEWPARSTCREWLQHLYEQQGGRSYHGEAG